jgi:hypothetical protein
MFTRATRCYKVFRELLAVGRHLFSPDIGAVADRFYSIQTIWRAVSNLQHQQALNG